MGTAPRWALQARMTKQWGEAAPGCPLTVSPQRGHPGTVHLRGPQPPQGPALGLGEEPGYWVGGEARGGVQRGAYTRRDSLTTSLEKLGHREWVSVSNRHSHSGQGGKVVPALGDPSQRSVSLATMARGQRRGAAW